jgi:hypothetical protein
LFALLVVAAVPALAQRELLPPTPAPIASDRSGHAGKRHQHLLRDYGQPAGNLPVRAGECRLLAAGPTVAAHHTVILMDSRGHGRSTAMRGPTAAI